MVGNLRTALGPMLTVRGDRRTRTSIVAVIWAAVIVVGVPVWWKTTEVYRAHLPFGDMQAWTEPGVGRPSPLRVPDRVFDARPRTDSQQTT